MRIKILYDNKAGGDGIISGWGFSCLAGDDVLFDTGEDGKSLINNMKKMDVDISGIKHIIISHDHWDHTGGIGEILRRAVNAEVYGCAGFGREFRSIIQKTNAKHVENNHLSAITGDVYTTGAISVIYKGKEIEEESLVIKTKNGISIVTGCAHPGIVKIVEHVKNLFSGENIYSVFGGFHLKDMSEKGINSVCDEFMSMGIKKIGPAHCSGDEAARIIRGKFQAGFIEMSAGTEFEV